MQDDSHGFTTPATFIEQFRDRYYAAYDREQEGALFAFTDTDALRQDHDQILQHAWPVLAERSNSGLLVVAATLVLLNDIQPITHQALAEAFGNEAASFVSACFFPMGGHFGEVERWEQSLREIAEAPAEVQLVRLALLFGQVEYSPQAVSHFPFWYREAEVMRNADPALRQQVLSRIAACETAEGG
ncbi:hypothetical protein SAMN02745148_01058 [Modicisalibacter ilicicola DSM 19980]|uniref:Uncharacterized protein n=1 Tax=Modicisalibacter ilicicola DSM 19980 TaxID=1121942 RepID=A0A1M4W3D6_9GAMM|nr:hypothetical protein [Halomonas ilicicola]SHE75650.1 hypothetical protein SAMN02745148_01058 [Halomonas ilicicola DSM 19980]